MGETNEFSFRLKPSEHGIGVFALHDIEKGTYLRLFGDKNKEGNFESRTRSIPVKDIPAELEEYCVSRGETANCPQDFGQMAVGWYLNHSGTPNAYHDDQYRYFALRDIKKDEELTIDYNSLEEPESAKDDYYKA